MNRNKQNNYIKTKDWEINVQVSAVRCTLTHFCINCQLVRQTLRHHQHKHHKPAVTLKLWCNHVDWHQTPQESRLVYAKQIKVKTLVTNKFHLNLYNKHLIWLEVDYIHFGPQKMKSCTFQSRHHELKLHREGLK